MKLNARGEFLLRSGVYSCTPVSLCAQILQNYVVHCVILKVIHISSERVANIHVEAYYHSQSSGTQ